MWNEWHGLGEYDGQPIAGGFQQLEVLRGAEWRKKSYSSTETNRFSHIKRIIATVKPEVPTQNLAVFDELWVSHEKSLTKMIAALQERGWIVKKSRKRKN